MIYLIIFLTLFFLPLPIHAQQFFEYPDNPVIKKDAASQLFLQPFILLKDTIYSAWFSDIVGEKAQVSTMKSTNGIDWFDKKTLQLSNTRNAGDPFMFEKNNEYRLYFSSSIGNGVISIWKSVSSDGVTFTPGQEKEVLKPVAEWERFSVSCPSLIEDQSIQYMFYAGAGQAVWAVGLATSTDDGATWNKCSNNPIIPEGAGQQVVKYNDAYYLFYHSSRGLQVQQAAVLEGCNTVWTNNRVITSSLTDPAPLVVGSDLWIYGNISKGIGLAGSVQITPPSYPIVLVPGMFSSWNADAILHNNPVLYDAWKINPNVTEYNAIIKTLENKGRVLNTDLFVFPYDWRKPINETTDTFNTFLTDKIWSTNPTQPIQIIGHSLGGMVSRIYADKNPTKPINKVIAAGAPLLGAVQAYKPLAAGEIDRENSLLWIAEKLVLLLNKSGLQSDKDTISQKLPVLFDILPAFPFLKNTSGSFIPSSLMNSLLTQYPIQSSPPISQFYLGGTGTQTLGGYVLGARTATDNLFGLYSDGRPIYSWTEDGDGSLLTKSMLNQILPAPVQNHGEIIYSKESIKSILSKVNIQAQDTDIPLGKATTIFPAILTFIQSPATMEITRNNITTQENEGMIHIQNAENGSYSLRVTGQSTGEYTVSIWLIGATEDKWFQFKKQTTSGTRDEYTISFDSITGGIATEFMEPTPTIQPTSKPSYTPEPTRKAHPTKKPTPTEKPHKHEDNRDKDKDKRWHEKAFKDLCDKLFKSAPFHKGKSVSDRFLQLLRL